MRHPFGPGHQLAHRLEHLDLEGGHDGDDQQHEDRRIDRRLPTGQSVLGGEQAAAVDQHHQRAEVAVVEADREVHARDMRFGGEVAEGDEQGLGAGLPGHLVGQFGHRVEPSGQRMPGGVEEGGEDDIGLAVDFLHHAVEGDEVVGEDRLRRDQRGEAPQRPAFFQQQAVDGGFLLGEQGGRRQAERKRQHADDDQDELGSKSQSQAACAHAALGFCCSAHAARAPSVPGAENGVGDVAVRLIVGVGGRGRGRSARPT